MVQAVGRLLGVVTVVALRGDIPHGRRRRGLRDALHLNGGFGPAALIARHAHAGMHPARLLLILFTGAFVVALLAHRAPPAWSAGPWLDTLAAQPAGSCSLRVALVVLAIACAYFVFHTGDLGAKAVWQGRLSGGGPGGGRRSRQRLLRRVTS